MTAPSPSVKANRCEILGFPIDLVDYDMVLEQIDRWRKDGICRFIIIATAADIYLSQDGGLKAAAARSGLNLPDGIAIVTVGRLLGYRPKGRVIGPDLMLKVCERGQDYGYRHFFYGSTKEVVGRLVDNLSYRFPRMHVAGLLCPPFRQLTPEEDALAVSQINACRPDIIWVGLGGTKQIRWMSDHIDMIKATAMIGVGAAFNFHSGFVRRAPCWIRRIGLEWSYRMITEPHKIIPRTRYTLMFCVKAMAQVLDQKLTRGILNKTNPGNTNVAR